MINFRRKSFSKKGIFLKSVESAGKYLKDNPTLPVSAAMLGVSVMNLKNSNKTVKDNRKQLIALERLTNTLTNVDNTLKTSSIPKYPKYPKEGRSFWQKLID